MEKVIHKANDATIKKPKVIVLREIMNSMYCIPSAPRR